MSIEKKTQKRPIVFGRKKTSISDNKNSKLSDNLSEDDTLDMLLHYAQLGMEFAEKSLMEKPNSFTTEERTQFEQNKNMLDQAPFLIETYKEQMMEHKALHRKMMDILKKCEEIISSGDDQAKAEVKSVLKEADILSYNEDGEIAVKKEAS